MQANPHASANPGTMAGSPPTSLQPWRTDAQAAGLVGVAHLSSHFFQMLMPPLYPLLMREFGIGFTEAGFLATIFFVISSSGQALAGFAVDRLGALRMLLVGMGLLVAAGLALAGAHSFGGLMLTAALAGAGNAMFHPADFTILNRRVSPGRLGHAFAMHALSGNLGWVAGTAFMSGVTALTDWRTAALCASVLALAVAVFLFTQRAVLEAPAGLPQAGAEALPPQSAHAGVCVQRVPDSTFAFLRSSTVLLCFAFFFLSTGAGGVLQNFAPAMLTHVYGVGMAFATAGLTVYFVGGACGTVLGGFLASQNRRSEQVVALALLVSACSSLLLATGLVPVIVLFPALFLLGAGTGSAAPSRDLLVRNAASTRFGPESFGRVYGFVYAGLDSGLAVAPLIVGRILDHGYFSAGLLFIGGLQVAAMLVALRVGRPE